ncbi:MAG: FAD-dependent oxidoreductase [Phycisphaerae bacterium]
MNPTTIVILGGGPTGVGAAWQLHQQQRGHAVLIERQGDVGGNSGGFELESIPCDFGSHRLHPACKPRIMADLRALLGEDLLDRPRHGRIRLRGRWIHFPLKPIDLIAHLPPSFALGVAGDSARKMVFRGANHTDETFASVLERGLGRTICRDFYFPYAVKLWGLPPEQLSPIQARRRVAAGSLGKMLRKVLSAVPGLKPPGAGRFFYPRGGFGQISRRIMDAARHAGAQIRLNSIVRSVTLGSPHHVEIEGPDGVQSIEARHVWSTIPVTLLAKMLNPAPPAEIVEAARQMHYRAMVLVYLVLGVDQYSEFDAHYFPEAEVFLSRMSEPKNYSARREPVNRTVLCGEVPCEVGDEVWNADEAALGERMMNALKRCELPTPPLLRTVVKRLPSAYPIYLRGYERFFEPLDQWLDAVPNVLSFGRQGLFAHDNTHHALSMAYAAAECVGGDGEFDRQRWRAWREEFNTHVVED